MLSNSTSKFIKSLQLKKFRKAHSSFFVEGKVNVLEILTSHHTISHILVTKEFYAVVLSLASPQTEVLEVTENDLLKVGTLKSNSFGLAVARIPESSSAALKDGEWALALDDVNDPGNLGTILRTADWFGISKVFCSMDTVDFYNPKVINSTKGSFGRVEVIYTDLVELLSTSHGVSAEMQGEPLYTFKWPSRGGVIVMGNESHGVSSAVSHQCKHCITIPKYGQAESLNVAVATSIICSDLRSKS